MNKKFILLLSFFIVLASCREVDEVMDNNKISTNELARSAGHSFAKDGNTTSENNFEIPADSTVNSLEEEDPPVKHGGHWRH